jgi:putative transcriptional regulator
MNTHSQPHHHPDEALLAEFAAGTLPPAQALAINAHLHYCHKCRDTLRELETLGGALLSQHETASFETDKAFDRLLERMDNEGLTDTADESANDSANHSNISHKKLPPKYKHLPSVIQKVAAQQKIKWKKVTGSLKSAPLFIGQKQFALSLQKINAGGRVPQHDHRGEEFTVVLKGSFSDEDGIYREGDFISRSPGDIHYPMASSNEDCLCLSVEQAPVKLTGLRGWLLNPFIRIQAG